MWVTFAKALGKILFEHFDDPPAKATMKRQPEYSRNASSKNKTIRLELD